MPPVVVAKLGCCHPHDPGHFPHYNFSLLKHLSLGNEQRTLLGEWQGVFQWSANVPQTTDIAISIPIDTG
jgi:hypothetical protein